MGGFALSESRLAEKTVAHYYYLTLAFIKAGINIIIHLFSPDKQFYSFGNVHAVSENIHKTKTVAVLIGTGRFFDGNIIG